MFGTQNLPVFIGAGLLLNITPGQDTMYILGRTLAQGRRAGVASVLGIASGSLGHTLFAAVGLSAILATSRTAFDVVRYAGAAYLAYLGVRMIVSRGSAPAAVDKPEDFTPQSHRSIFFQGWLTNMLNPKVALFFLSFLPQFIDPSAGSKAIPMLFLGALFTFNGTIWCLILVLGAAAISRRIRANAAASVGLSRAAGAVFIALGIRLAVSR